jgi:S-adenosyl methyltransferase
VLFLANSAVNNTPNGCEPAPVSARIWNYWMGGTDYFPVDKAAGDQYAAVFPGIFDLARASRGFIIRVVRYLAGEAGIRQFLDIGTGLPSHDNTHEIVQRVAPESRVVYVDNDPMVIACLYPVDRGDAQSRAALRRLSRAQRGGRYRPGRERGA